MASYFKRQARIMVAILIAPIVFGIIVTFVTANILKHARVTKPVPPPTHSNPQ
jgi:hypothetical protein